LTTFIPGPLNTNPAPDNSAESLKDFNYPRQRRLLIPAQFAAVFAEAPLRATHPNFLILARANTLGYPRLGLVIPKKHVRRANKRNRIKRIARETFRKEQHKFAGIDAIVLARHGADIVPTQQLTSIFIGLWKRISKRAIAPAP
jgi:ribonuclease P protein component